jgi:thiol-disulfide isomerase/thioredoxin
MIMQEDYVSNSYILKATLVAALIASAAGLVEGAGSPLPAGSKSAAKASPAPTGQFATLGYGQPVDISKLPVPGKTTVIDFFSEYCGPCQYYSGLLETYLKTHPNVVVRRLDINRKGVVGIDWASPLARQYNLVSIPAFVIYDPKGKIIAKGPEASSVIDEWVSEKSK